MGIIIFFIMIICISIIVVIFSVIVAFLSVLISSLLKKRSNKMILGIKVFIITLSGVISAGFGLLILYLLNSFEILNIDNYINAYYILFSIIGLIIGILIALLVNKIIVNPIINLISKIKYYAKKSE
jgi:hypothetical protein